VTHEDGRKRRRISYNIPASQNLLSGIEEGCQIKKGPAAHRGLYRPSAAA
jgi:DNA-directed RNA polymerase subunit beta'